MPSSSAKTEVYVNNEKQNIDVIPNSYISLNREWKNNDKIRLAFHYEFYEKPMPDDKNVVAIFYGPMLLAFETPSELIIKQEGSRILDGLSVVDMGRCLFQLRKNGKIYTLRPLYDIEAESYGVYATIREY